jgi:predicted HTH domain antitoxin
MYSTNVRDLKKDPRRALRQAEDAPVLILDENEPNALILHLDSETMDAQRSLRPVLAAALFKDGALSLGAAAELSGLGYAEFLRHLDWLGIAVVDAHVSSDADARDLESWTLSSSRTPVP